MRALVVFGRTAVIGYLENQPQPKRLTTLKLTIKYALTILGFTILFPACNRVMPAGFWTTFHKGFIVSKSSDQGPWGGTRAVNWKRGTNNPFTDKELIDFADKNNWKLIDSISFRTDTLTKNSFAKLKNDNYSKDILYSQILPKLKPDDGKIFIFKTTWLNVEPGNARETFEDGFAVLNLDKTELKVYHFWGE